MFLLFSNNIISQCPTGYYSTGIERVVNGNFESGNVSFTSQYTYVANKAGVQNELVPEAYYSVWTNPNDLHTGFSACTDKSGSGNLMIVNGATVAGVKIWEENISVSQNTKYYFTTWICSVNPSNPAKLQFSVNGVLLGSIFNASSTTCVWQQFYATWDSGNNTTADISVVNQNTAANGNDFGLDNISFIPCAQDVMPISSGLFRATVVDDNFIKLFWQTFSEENNNYFTLERSLDAFNYDSIATVKGSGNSSSIINYSILDKYPFSGVSYYRLKQTDFDGNSKIIGTTAINNSNSNNIKSIINFNGEKEYDLIFKYFSKVDDNYKITIFSIDGKVISQQEANAKMGFNLFTFNTIDINKGIYLISIQNAYEQYNSRFVIK